MLYKCVNNSGAQVRKKLCFQMLSKKLKQKKVWCTFWVPIGRIEIIMTVQGDSKYAIKKALSNEVSFEISTFWMKFWMVEVCLVHIWS